MFGVREGVVVDAQKEMRRKTPLAFGVREGVVVHAVIVPVGFVAPWHPVIIVVIFNTYKTLSVKMK
jgi:hypothetical protein